MINSDQAKEISDNAENETAEDSPRLDDESRFKVASAFWYGFEKRALLDSDQVEFLSQKAKRRDLTTLQSARLDESQRVGWGSGATQ